MSTAIPMNIKSDITHIYDEIDNSKRNNLHQSIISTSRKSSPTNSKKHFIPFVRERDQLGRLIKNTTDESMVSKNISALPTLPFDSVNMKSHSRKNSADKLPNLYHHNSKSLFKMVEDGIKTEPANESVLTGQSRGMNYSNFNTSLYRIGQCQDNALEVQVSPKAKATSISSVPQSSVIRNDITPRIPPSGSVSPKKSPTEKLPPLNVHHIPDNHSLLGSITAKSADTLVSHDLGYQNSSINADASSLINVSAWRYEASQVAKNQDMENLLKKEHKAFSLGKLIKVTHGQIMPPIGSYEPSMNLVAKRQRKCVILPEQIEKLKALKRKEAQIEKLELARLQASSNANTARDDDTSDEYYKNLFRGMLKEADDRQKKTKKNDPSKKAANTKKLDYIVLEDFKQFPTDFEHQINTMKAKLRHVKDKITGNKDLRNNHD